MSYIDDEELKIDISNDDEDDEKDLDEGLNDPVDDDLLEDDDLLVSEFAPLDGSLY